MNINPELVVVKQRYQTKEEAIRACGELLVKAGCVEADYVDAMIERNKLVSVYMGNFIAIPHGTDEAKKYVKKSGISIIQVPAGVNFGTEEDEQLAMVLFGLAGKDGEHLDLLQKIAIFCSDVENVVKLADAQSAEEIVRYFEEVE